MLYVHTIETFSFTVRKSKFKEYHLTSNMNVVLSILWNKTYCRLDGIINKEKEIWPWQFKRFPVLYLETMYKLMEILFCKCTECGQRSTYSSPYTYNNLSYPGWGDQSRVGEVGGLNLRFGISSFSRKTHQLYLQGLRYLQYQNAESE